MHLDLGPSGREDQVEGPVVAYQEPLAVAIVMGQLSSQDGPFGGQTVDTVDIGEEGLAGVRLRSLQEPQGGQINEPGRQAAVAQRPNGLWDIEPFGSQLRPPLMSVRLRRTERPRCQPRQARSKSVLRPRAARRVTVDPSPNSTDQIRPELCGRHDGVDGAHVESPFDGVDLLELVGDLAQLLGPHLGVDLIETGPQLRRGGSGGLGQGGPEVNEPEVGLGAGPDLAGEHHRRGRGATDDRGEGRPPPAATSMSSLRAPENTTKAPP